MFIKIKNMIIDFFYSFCLHMKYLIHCGNKEKSNIIVIHSQLFH